MAVQLDTWNRQNLTWKGDHLRRKIKLWGRLRNEHILPLLGLCHGYGPLPGLVSPWMENGILSDFLYKRHNTLTRYERFRLASASNYDLTYVSNLPMF